MLARPPTLFRELSSARSCSSPRLPVSRVWVCSALPISSRPLVSYIWALCTSVPWERPSASPVCGMRAWQALQTDTHTSIPTAFSPTFSCRGWKFNVLLPSLPWS